MQASACTEAQCARGCRFVLDKLVEHEGDRVLSCIAKSTRGCGDEAFAGCAALTGIHADGGPPPPNPATDVDLAGDDDDS